MDSSLLPFFHPRGVVIVGVSADPTKLGYGLARNLVHSGYADRAGGAIHFVNPKGGALFDRPVHPSVASVPDPVDLGVLVIPAAAVPDALRACGERGLRAIIIASGGFREIGPEGAALEAECLRIARAYGLRLIGPNCIGLLDTHLPLDTTFLPPSGLMPGEVAFLSHSGAICEAVIDWASGQGFGLSRLISLGNQADLTEADLLVPVAEDPHTRVLTLYLEGINHGRQFVAQASQVTRHKPVIALKVGRFESGQKAVASHTGALAGKEAAYTAAFRRAGVIRAETSEEMFDWARALAWCPLPEGRTTIVPEAQRSGTIVPEAQRSETIVPEAQRSGTIVPEAQRSGMAVLTNAGGPGAIAADALESHDLALAELRDSTRAALRELLPPAASARNPVDMLASASPDQYAASLRILLDDPGVNGVLVILPPPPMYTAESVAQALIPVIQPSRKPVVIALMGENLIRTAAELLRAAHIPDYRFPERAASALAMLVRRAETLARPATSAIMFTDTQPEVVRGLLAGRPPGSGGWLNPDEANGVLEAYGIPVPRIELARTADEASRLAQRIGFPVALKVASPDIPHKSDVGGVLLNLSDAASVAEAFVTITGDAHAVQPSADILGAHVQPMLPAGQEVIVGVVQDPQFGPLVMFGSGGVEVEGLKDVQFGLAPLSHEEAEYLLDNTWAGRKLRGHRNLPPADRAAVLACVRRIAQLAVDFPSLTEIEINPLRVMRAGQGAVAVDVRIRLS
jgi:acetyltransferase